MVQLISTWSKWPYSTTRLSLAKGGRNEPIDMSIWHTYTRIGCGDLWWRSGVETLASCFLTGESNVKPHARTYYVKWKFQNTWHMSGENAYHTCEIKRENSGCMPKFNREECAILWVQSNCQSTFQMNWNRQTRMSECLMAPGPKCQMKQDETVSAIKLCEQMPPPNAFPQYNASPENRVRTLTKLIGHTTWCDLAPRKTPQPVMNSRIWSNYERMSEATLSRN